MVKQISYGHCDVTGHFKSNRHTHYLRPNLRLIKSVGKLCKCIKSNKVPPTLMHKYPLVSTHDSTLRVTTDQWLGSIHPAFTDSSPVI